MRRLRLQLEIQLPQMVNIMPRAHRARRGFFTTFNSIVALVIAYGCGSSSSSDSTPDDKGSDNTSGAAGAAGNQSTADAGENGGASGSVGGPTDGGSSGNAGAAEDPGDPLLIGTLSEVQDAVVRIVAEGAFRDPADSATYAVSGQGSGFIIDPSGIAVTNNHVVTGQARLKIYFNGESTPRNARVLGVSECSDLAVIDIEGDGYRYLEWYGDEITAGLDVYTIGYPLGVTDVTMTRGIVSQPHADGETTWSSIDDVIQHDATINPGSSGGPLVTPAGQVVGVNYAANREASQYFAVGPDETFRVFDELLEGRDVTSIGINGSIVQFTSGAYGIWVAAVSSGSPADEVGILPGDIIMGLENLPASTEGTFEEYCDTLRSRDDDDPLKILVYRMDTGSHLEGTLNGSRLSVMCPWTNDGVCDEPQGTDACVEGTDTEDCSTDSGCPWTNDDECDEPEGTGLCAEGTDSADCA